MLFYNKYRYNIVKKRINACVKLLKASSWDALLVSDPVNVAYLAGFNSPGGYLLITKSADLLYFTNFLYIQAASKISLWKPVITNGRNIFTLIAEWADKVNLNRIGFEAKHLPFLEYETVREKCALKGISLSPTRDFIAKLRMLKSSQEIALIKKSVSISKEAFEFVKEIRGGGMTEKDLGIEIERFLRLKGDNQLAFNPIVAAGANSSFPHHEPGDNKIGNKCVLIDLGSKYCGYCADLTRVYFEGKISTLFKKIYDIVRKAQELSIRKIRDGVAAAAVDKTAREYIDKRGWGKYFGHGLGHGVGLAVHEPPFLNSKTQEILQEGTVITVEPAIYLPNKFGVRIEDMVVVRRKKGEML